MNWDNLQESIIHCARCERLRTHCSSVAEVKRAAFSDSLYWGRPVPNLGSPEAELLIVGLAPAAHGANRTGRMFTGDRSGDYLFKALSMTGWCNQAESVSREDGLQLNSAVITAIAHCAPPDNKPLPEEIAHCRSYLRETIEQLPELKTIVCLGKIAFDETVKTLGLMEVAIARPKPKFAHGAAYTLDFREEPLALLASYHPSQQNTFTGRVTLDMLVAIFNRARRSHS
jgi:uracil-DNA glycosylase family 4